VIQYLCSTLKSYFERLSLKNKIFFSMILAIMLISASIALLARWILVSSLTQELENRGNAIGQSIAQRGREYLLDQDYPKLLALIFDEAKLQERRQLIAYIFIQNKQGKVIAHTFIRPFPTPILNQVASLPQKQRLVHLNGQTILDIANPITEGLYQIGIVHVGLKKSHVEQLVSKLRITFLGFISLVIALIFGLSHYLASHITEPLLKITNMAKEISKGNFDLNLDPKRASNCPAFKDSRFPCWHLDELGLKQEGSIPLRRCKECMFYQKGEGNEFDQLQNSFLNMLWSIKLYRQRLKESEERYKSLFVSGPDPIFVIDVKELNILDCNPKAAQVYAYTQQELKKMSFDRLWPEAKEYLQNEKSPLFQEGCLYLSRIIHFKKNQPFFVNLNACIISYQCKPAIIISTSDVTEIVEKDAQIIQAGKMKALGEMAAGIAHEINQPLNIIHMGTDLIELYFEGHEVDLAELKQVAKEIKAQVKRAAEIVQNLRQFSRKSSLVPQEVNLNQVVTTTLSFLKQQFALENISFELHLDSKLPLIWGEENRLQQVLFNLLLNAKDAIIEKQKTHSHYQGQITIQTFDKGDKVVLLIKDNGPGIDPKLKNKIFEPFFTTKDKGKGMGLGLSIVQGIIKEHRGSIECFSSSKGTIFKLIFPLKLKESSHDNKTKSPGHR